MAIGAEFHGAWFGHSDPPRQRNECRGRLIVARTITTCEALEVDTSVAAPLTRYLARGGRAEKQEEKMRRNEVEEKIRGIMNQAETLGLQFDSGLIILEKAEAVDPEIAAAMVKEIGRAHVS